MGRLAAQGYYRSLHAHDQLVHYVGSFTCNGAGAATSCKGKGYSIAKIGTGRYRITLNKRFAEFTGLGLHITQATAGNDAAYIDHSTLSLGDVRTPASFVIETQSVAGTAADLTGMVVSFDVWMSDRRTRSVVST